MKYRAVIFDLDGVICFTDKYHYQAWKSVADELGIYFDEKINDRLRGVSRKASFEIILENYDGTMGEEDLSKEVKDTLDQLRERGLSLAIGSSSKNAGFILHQLGLGEYFDAVSDGNLISKSKPDPEVFIKAAELLGENPEDCLVVEDAKAGVQAAKAGGMDCAALGDGAKSGLADYNMAKFSDLSEIVK